MSGGKGVIEIAIKCPAGQDEIPALGPIQEIVFSAEACLIFADGNVPVVIQCDGIWRHTVMEVKYFDRGMEFFHFCPAISNIHRYKMVHTKAFLSLRNDVGDPPLPLHRDSAEIGLVADFVIKVIEVF